LDGSFSSKNWFVPPKPNIKFWRPIHATLRPMREWREIEGVPDHDSCRFD
jgi:hypothetical protein